MSTARALLLYAPFVRRCAEESVPCAVHRLPRRPGFQTRRHLAQRVNQRYGTANEPSSQPGRGKAVALNLRDQEKKTTSALITPGTLSSAKEPVMSTAPAPKSSPPAQHASGNHVGQSTTDSSSGLVSTSMSSAGQEAKSSSANMPPTTRASTGALSPMIEKDSKSLETTPAEEKPPHLEAPPYVHHFDTYTLVQSLQENNAFTYPQSVTVMKAVRDLLTDNMDLARHGLVSRGDAEMDTYQFRAAAGELRTEIRKRRAVADERMRAERLQLQHEVDTLGQRMTQESLTLKDELKGMFDDRKMAVQLERRNVDNRIQELGYKITVAMNSGMRNEIEGLRFILTRRTVLALAGVVLMVLALLRLASHQREVNKRKEAANSTAGTTGVGPALSPTSGVTADRIAPGMDPRSEEVSRRVQNGDNPALVSLG